MRFINNKLFTNQNMKKGLILLIAGWIFLGTFAQPAKAPEKLEPKNPADLRKVTNNAFKAGEFLKYKVYYGLIDAGFAELEVKEMERGISGRKVYHIVGNGYSQGTFDFFFRVRDKYETYLDAEGLFPWVFVRRVDEGGYIINQDYKFYQHKNIVETEKGNKHEVQDYMQDALSAFYYARSTDFSNAKPGDVFTYHTFIDEEVFPLSIKYIGKETIKVDGVKYKCLKFRPVVQKGRIFKREEDLNVWVTDDENKIPIFASAKILVGSIKMELVEYKNLANPVAIDK
jgi:hypothetical protein